MRQATMLLGLILLLGLWTGQRLEGRAGGGEDYSSSSDDSGYSSSSDDSYSSSDSSSGYDSSSSNDYYSSDSDSGGSSGDLSAAWKALAPERKRQIMTAVGAVVIAGILVYVLFPIGLRAVSGSRQQEKREEILRPPPERSTTYYSALERLMERDPGFVEAAFLGRATEAFVKLQKAWSEQDLTPVAPFLADGLLERLSLQLREQKALGIRNVIADLAVEACVPADLQSTKHYDSFHVYFRARAGDFKVDAASGTMLSGESNEPVRFTEIWSFLRRPGAKTVTKSGLFEGSCPNCSASITMSKTGKCPACGTLLAGGEYDWVLAEITQHVEWKNPGSFVLPGLKDLETRDPGFNMQAVEDRATAVFFRFIEAARQGTAAPLQGLASKKLCTDLEKIIGFNPEGTKLVYQNVAVGAVELGAVKPGEQDDRLFVNIHWSGRARVIDQSGRLVSLSAAPLNHHHVYVFSRQKQAATNTKLGLYGIHCGTCGAPQNLSFQNICAYCDSVLNNEKTDWVLTRIARKDDEEFAAARIAGPTA